MIQRAHMRADPRDCRAHDEKDNILMQGLSAHRWRRSVHAFERSKSLDGWGSYPRSRHVNASVRM